MSAPLIVSLGLDPAAQERFEALRRAHFPRERLVVGAHLTLFHHLPGGREADVERALRDAADGELHLVCDGVLRLGRGTALRVDGPGLHELRARIAAPFAEELTPQDARWGRPHVTVQNKVTPEAARALHDELSSRFAPFAVRGEALRLWRYAGGPWEHVVDVPLQG